ncbi:unnamed protein product, partial [Amoebophrya sp. A25]
HVVTEEYILQLPLESGAEFVQQAQKDIDNYRVSTAQEDVDVEQVVEEEDAVAGRDGAEKRILPAPFKTLNFLHKLEEEENRAENAEESERRSIRGGERVRTTATSGVGEQDEAPEEPPLLATAGVATSKLISRKRSTLLANAFVLLTTSLPTCISILLCNFFARRRTRY